MSGRYDLDDADLDRDEEPTGECQHTHVAAETGYPMDRTGRCEAVWICEDCQVHLGHAGWDSVL